MHKSTGDTRKVLSKPVAIICPGAEMRRATGTCTLSCTVLSAQGRPAASTGRGADLTVLLPV